MTVEQFEYLIIGGGKAGKTLAATMSTAGHTVAMVEMGMIGGTCINVACIPTKTMVESAKVAERLPRAEAYGVRAGSGSAEAVGVRARKRVVVAEMVARNQANFDRSGMTLVIGLARFTAPRTVEVTLAEGGTRILQGEKVFINTGTRPALPDIPGLAAANPLNSESIQEMEQFPDHLLILGGGYVACEFAQMFRRFGSRVTLIERSEEFLKREDRDVADEVLKIFREDGIEVHTGATVTRIEGLSGEQMRVTVQSKTGARALSGSHLLAALGRTPNTEELNLSAAGVEVDGRGYIQVNERLETSAENAWALGDVNGGPQFTHASLDDFRIVRANLSGGARTTTDRVIPYTLFIDPELGRVGMTEEEARGAGYSVKVARLRAAAIPRAVTFTTRQF